VTPIRMHAWGRDPFARGSYSCALPGKADSRARLAAPVDGRLFFAGEACSTHDFSTAHSALLTGIAAADAALTARRAPVCTSFPIADDTRLDRARGGIFLK
jgi:monoamine oxidase